jgi:hypothetical protein
MGRLRKILLPLIVVAAIITGVTGVAIAAHNVDISGNTNKTIYHAGQTVRVSGTVNGDVICAGQTVTIDANVNGDVICGAQTINLNGDVSGSARLAGQTININGKVAKSVSVIAQDVTLSKNASVGVDAGIIAQTTLVDGSVGRDISGTVNRLTIAGPVGRNVEANVHTLSLVSGANINGNVTYTSNNDIETVPAAMVGGKVVHKTPAKRGAEHHRTFAVWLAINLLWLAFILLLAMALILLFPRMFVNWNAYATSHPWRTLLVGFIASIVAPIVFVALMISIIGIPIGLVYALLMLIAAILAIPLAAFYLGDQIFRHRSHILLVMLVGILVLWVIGLIPILGGIVMLFAFWLGLGIVLTNTWRVYQRPRYAREVEVASVRAKK